MAAEVNLTIKRKLAIILPSDNGCDGQPSSWLPHRKASSSNRFDSSVDTLVPSTIPKGKNTKSSMTVSPKRPIPKVIPFARSASSGFCGNFWKLYRATRAFTKSGQKTLPLEFRSTGSMNAIDLAWRIAAISIKPFQVASLNKRTFWARLLRFPLTANLLRNDERRYPSSSQRAKRAKT